MLTTSDIEAILEKNGFTKSIAGEDHIGVVTAFNKAISLNRGVLLKGSCGCGKTTALKAWRNHFHTRLNISCANPQQMAWLDTTDSECMKLASEGNFSLDDVGSESPKNEYGIKIEPIEKFIAWVYDDRYCHKWRNIPVITTNLSSEEWVKRYGTRIASRLKEMFVFYVFKGKDKRQASIIK